MTTETYDKKPKFDPNKPFEPVDEKPAFDPNKPFEAADEPSKKKSWFSRLSRIRIRNPFYFKEG